ncbi:MAG: hypothetical protein HQ555_11875 [Candidatus Aminicenantes bacterium]|nr:hypothetical protein [Candidatus Aminicenantes bacterium]
MEEKIRNIRGKQRLAEIFILSLIFFTVALGYFYKERTETPRSKHFNLIAREIPIVVENNPDNFVKDPITNPQTMYQVKHIWTQKLLLNKLLYLFGDFHTARRYLLFVLVFLTCWTTFILYKYITNHTIISILASLASIVGYIYGVDECYGFQGIDTTIARYNFGIFAPLLLLFFLKKYNSHKWLLLLFFILGVGVNFHPPVAINITIVFILFLLVIEGLKKNITWIVTYAVLFIIGALPFILDYGMAAMTRGTVESHISASEFYESGIYLLTTQFLIEPFSFMFEELIFPPFISLVALSIAFFIFIKDISPKNRSSEKPNITFLLGVVALISYFLLFLNLFLFGWLIPHLVGPHAFSLYRVHRVFFLLTEALLTIFIVAIWRDVTQSLFKRVAIIAILLINLALGFNWLCFITELSPFLGNNILMRGTTSKIIQIIFFILVALFLLLSILSKTTNRKFIFIASLIIIITIPNFVLCGGYHSRILGTIRADQPTETYQKEFGLLKDLIRWAKQKTEKTSLFMFSSKSPNDSSYFKVRAIRSTTSTNTKSEALHYLPLRQRKSFLRKLEYINRVMNSKDMNNILKLINEIEVDYIVFSRNRHLEFNFHQFIPVFENGLYVVYSLSSIKKT